MRLFKAQAARGGIILPSSTQRYRPGLIVCIILLGLVPLVFSNPYIHTLGALTIIFGVFAISIDILAGYIGLLALGQAAYFGFGAYVCGYLTTKAGWGHLPAIVMAVLATGLLSLAFGAVTIKVWGSTFFMITIAIVQVIWGMATKMTAITGGENGIGGIKRPSWFGINFRNSTNFYYLIFIVLILVVIIAYRFVNSPFGLTVHGIRESRQRMRALGYNVSLHKLITFVFAGLISGLAGVMYCYFNRFVSPGDINTLASSTAFLMTLLGGVKTLVGALIGSAVVTVLKNYVSSYTDRWQTVMGVLYVLVIMLSPGGLVGAYKTIKDKFTRKKKTAGAGENTEDVENGAALEEEVAL